MQKYIIIFITLFFVLVISSCQKKEEFIKVFIQPQLKINESINLEIYFKELPDEESLRIEKSNDNFNIEEVGAWITDSNEKTGIKTYKYLTYLTPKKTGDLNLPIISAKFNDIKHVSKQYNVEVFEDLKITEDAVFIELKSNKKSFQLHDTIIIELFEYSRFINIRKKTVENELKHVYPKINGEKGNIKVKSNISILKLSGIKGLEKYISNSFEVISFDFDPFKTTGTFKESGNKMYYKNLLFKLVLQPKKRGNFKINKSKFIYSIYKSNDEFFENVLDDNGTKLKVESNPLIFEVN